MSSQNKDAHPTIMWGAMFETLDLFDPHAPKWRQRGPLFPTMNEAAAWGEENKPETHFDAPHIQPYEVSPTEVTATFKDPNNMD